ncbi:MAG TPA: SMP-30/gluconolactonase/LRE family protein [Acidobacteriaceae bacterium]
MSGKQSRFSIFILIAFCIFAPCMFAQARYTVSEEDASTPGSPRVIVLRDNTAGVEAAVAPSEGGELTSYRVKFKGQWIELLYRARDYAPGPGFRGKAPLLWPAVGPQYPVGTIPKSSCGDGTYQTGGKTYPMPCHGFARTFPWNEVSRSTDNQGTRVTVELRDSDGTRRFYPFAFKVDATYQISNGLLSINYAVTSDASNAEKMPFSIGNHIAFKLPFVEGSDPATMTFETPNTTQLLRNPTGAGLNGKEEQRSFDLPKPLGDFDARVALPLAGYRSQPYARLADPGGLSIRISQTASTDLPPQMIRFNVYGGPKEGYLSPEPWFGIQNSLNLHEGLVTLAAGDSWKWRIQLQVSGPAPSMQAATPGVERFGGDFGYVEGPVWSKAGFLIFSDMYDSRIVKMTAANRPEIYREYTNAANGNSMDVQGRLYSCERDGRRVVRMEKDGQLTVIASEFEGKRLNDPNDVVVRHDGQVYFTDPIPNDVLEPLALGYAGVYHVTPQGEISLVTKMRRPNGVTLTPDGRTLFVADTIERKIMAYDLDEQGNASNERVFISGIDGGPDGLRVAANGNLYIACRGIAIYSPDGKFIKMIEFPETPANCTFGDSDLRTLYVTARTSVYRVRIPDKGSLLY